MLFPSPSRDLNNVAPIVADHVNECELRCDYLSSFPRFKFFVCLVLLMVEWIWAVQTGTWALATVTPWLRNSCSCECSFHSPPTDQRILDLLASQLDRCGPANLTAVPTVVPPPRGVADLVFAWVCGVFVGASLLLVWSRRVPVTSEFRSPTRT